jgi:hypothetical protein
VLDDIMGSCLYATWSLGLYKPGKTLIPTFMSFSTGSKTQQSKPKPPPLFPLMLLQCTNKTAISISLILTPHKSFVQPIMTASAKFLDKTTAR